MAIALLVAAAHVFPLGELVSGDAHRLYFSYFSDVTLSFMLYFLLVQAEIPHITPWPMRTMAAFLAPSACEVLQYFGIWALGSVFDPWDFVAYALGILAAAIVDRQLLLRIFPFWRAETGLGA